MATIYRWPAKDAPGVLAAFPAGQRGADPWLAFPGVLLFTVYKRDMPIWAAGAVVIRRATNDLYFWHHTGRKFLI